MINQQMLEALIKKAIEDGWLPNRECLGTFYIAEWAKPNMFNSPEQSMTICFHTPVEVSMGGYMYHVTDIIFNHEFAEAVFGSEWPRAKEVADWEHVPRWKAMLQNAVISDEPIRYMYEQVFNE